ncbi:MAG: sulfite exporter TauE/SafE family protein [Gaiellaceae bacterium]
MHAGALALVLLALWCFAVALAGGVAGLVLGNLRLPVVLLAATTPAAGAGANIGISAVAAAAAAIVHVRAGRINWRLFAWMAPPSVAGAVIGGIVSGALPSGALLLVIGAALVWFGLGFVRDPAPPPRAARTGAPVVRAAVVTGFLIGLLGGLVGLILGSLRMPALIRYVGETPSRAVGTNLTVGLCVGVAGVVGHAPSGVDWVLLGIGAAASIPGALAGARMSGRLSERGLLTVVGTILLIAGTVVLVQGILAVA